MARVLIVGAAGFIGSHVARRCVDRGDEVHAIVRSGSSLDRLQEFTRRLRIHNLDAGDRDRLIACLTAARPEQVFLLASRTRWQDRADLADAHGSVAHDLLGLLSFLAVAAAARPAPRVVIRAGTLAEYGAGPTPYVETQREAPLNAYAAAAVAGTHFAEMLQARLSFPVITARLALVYGPGQSDDFLIPTLIRDCFAGRQTTLARPLDRRDLLYVDDAVDALLRLADVCPPGARVVNVATGNSTSVRDVADQVVLATGRANNVSINTTRVSGGIADLRGSTNLMRDLTGWRAATPLSAGLERTVAWYRAQLAAAHVSK